MASRRNQLQAAALTKSSSSLKPSHQATTQPSSTLPSVRRHVLLVMVDVPDRSSLLATLAQLLPVRCLVGVGNCWYSSDRIKLDDAPNTLEAASKSISTLLDKMDKPTSVDIVLLIGREEVPAPDQLIDLFSLLDTALNQSMYHVTVRITCLQKTRLNDWDVLLGASVVRVPTFEELNSSCFDDKNVVFRGSLMLPGERTIPGIVLTLQDDANLADAKKCFGSSQQIMVLSQVRIDSVPVILFRKSFRGEMHWNSSRSVGHRVLSYWSRGLGIMNDDHGLFMQIVGGPTILVYCSNQNLHYRTIISIEEESKMVAVKQALSHCDRYACSHRIV